MGLCLDVWEWHVGGGTLEQLREFPVEKIVMVRIADLPADANLETVTEEERLLPGRRERSRLPTGSVGCRSITTRGRSRPTATRLSSAVARAPSRSSRPPTHLPCS